MEMMRGKSLLKPDDQLNLTEAVCLFTFSIYRVFVVIAINLIIKNVVQVLSKIVFNVISMIND